MSRRYYLALFAVTLLSLTSGGRYAFAQSLKIHLPVVDYAAESQTENYGTASACYHRPGSQPIVELPAGTDELPINAHWWVGLPALPVEQSDAVVIGEVERAQAHLSTDKTGIYSEFTIRLEDVLKGRSEEAVPGVTVIAERFGGGGEIPKREDSVLPARTSGRSACQHSLCPLPEGVWWVALLSADSICAPRRARCAARRT